MINYFTFLWGAQLKKKKVKQTSSKAPSAPGICSLAAAAGRFNRNPRGGRRTCHRELLLRRSGCPGFCLRQAAAAKKQENRPLKKKERRRFISTAYPHRPAAPPRPPAPAVLRSAGAARVAWRGARGVSMPNPPWALGREQRLRHLAPGVGQCVALWSLSALGLPATRFYRPRASCSRSLPCAFLHTIQPLILQLASYTRSPVPTCPLSLSSPSPPLPPPNTYTLHLKVASGAGELQAPLG
jgi:hypothetical protein